MFTNMLSYTNNIKKKKILWLELCQSYENKNINNEKVKYSQSEQSVQLKVSTEIPKQFSFPHFMTVLQPHYTEFIARRFLS